MARWGVATIVKGQVAGVAGCFRLRHTAERSARHQQAQLEVDAKRVDGYRVVRRSSSRSPDWGLRPVVDLRNDSEPATADQPLTEDNPVKR